MKKKLSKNRSLQKFKCSSFVINQLHLIKGGCCDQGGEIPPPPTKKKPNGG